MDILSEIIEISNQMIYVLDESGFFDENQFIDSLPLKQALQIKMQRKWEQENDMYLTDAEFLEVCNEVHEQCIADSIESLVDKGALNMSVGEDGDIYYSNNPDFDINNL
jgi:hypothetical protein